MNIFDLTPETVVTITAGDLQQSILTALAMIQAQRQEWLTTAQATERYCTSWSTLKRLQQTGVLHPTRVGAQWRWSVNELENNQKTLLK